MLTERFTVLISFSGKLVNKNFKAEYNKNGLSLKLNMNKVIVPR